MTTTIYNGSKACTRCGGHISPVQAMIDKDRCTSCRRQEHADHVRGGMANGRQRQP